MRCQGNVREMSGNFRVSGEWSPCFEPVAVEALGVFNASARHLLSDLGRRISLNLGEARETSFLYQRISILVQRFNAVLLHDSLPAVDSTD